MTDTKQPEALRLAKVSANLIPLSVDAHLISAELERQQARIAELEAQEATALHDLQLSYVDVVEERDFLRARAAELEAENRALSADLKAAQADVQIIQDRHTREMEVSGADGVTGVRPKTGLYYLQDSRSYVGNCPLWWAKGGRGYTSNLDEAELYPFEGAVALHSARDTDIPWPCHEIDALRRATVDHQYFPRTAEAQRAAIAQEGGKNG